jgi:hypothetical protein
MKGKAVWEGGGIPSGFGDTTGTWGATEVFGLPTSGFGLRARDAIGPRGMGFLRASVIGLALSDFWEPAGCWFAEPLYGSVAKTGVF